MLPRTSAENMNVNKNFFHLYFWPDTVWHCFLQHNALFQAQEETLSTEN